MKDSALNWVKSSYSSSGNCIETAGHAGRVLVRDTKQAGTGPVLTITPAAWKAFTGSLKTR